VERAEMIARAAAALRAGPAGQNTAGSTAQGLALVEMLLAQHCLEVQRAPMDGSMLGGASARLQIFDWEHPEYGGIVWLREGLSSARQAFALAHELGHFALHRGEGAALRLRATCAESELDERADVAALGQRNGRVEEYTSRSRREQEANAFSAELLAPRAAVHALFIARHGLAPEALAAHFGISEALAQQRLIDAVLTDRIAPAESAAPATAPVASPPDPRVLVEALDATQRAAARSAAPALVVAGPGTGKTATLVGRVAHLVAERGIKPEKILALTFSNRAAGEMRERLAASGLPGERMPVMTIHAFATTLLREYALYVPHAPGEAPLAPDFRILDQTDSFLLMEELLGELPLHYYRSLGNPTRHLSTLLGDFSRARDNLLSPAEYMARVAAMPLAPDLTEPEPTAKKARARSKPKPPEGTYSAEQIAKARERAAAYGVWDCALRRRGLLDFGGLIQRAVELLRASSAALREVRGRYPQVLVDEFQDTNLAAAELLFLVAGESGAGLWVVGDRNQAIYRWRGASPANLPRLAALYPDLRLHTLGICYRSVPAIVGLGSAAAERMAALAPATEMLPAGTDLPAVLHEALTRPAPLSAIRLAESAPPVAPVARGEAYPTGAHERAGLAMAIAQAHTAGMAYRDQAVLCRTHKQVAAMAAALSAAGLPVSERGDFFERAEVKDALALLALAAGPDGRGLLRAGVLLAALSGATPSVDELRALAVEATVRRGTFPAGLASLAAAPPEGVPCSPETTAALHALAEVATGLRYAPLVGDGLARFLLRPGGYACRLARIADGLAAPDPEGALAGTAGPVGSREALAALGALVGLAARFGRRWHGEPDFRARLTRAVRHLPRRIPDAPSLPDAAELPAAADVAMPDEGAPAVPSRAADAVEAADAYKAGTEAVAPEVMGFLHYLRALRNAGGGVALPAGEEDAVPVMTLHASKGLEFLVVYLPGLAKGQFPVSHQATDPSPPGFRGEDDLAIREAEERCLFYVGLTRARDRVVLTRALRYGKSAARPSSLLALVEDAPPFVSAPTLHGDAELAELIPAMDQDAADDDDEEGDDEGPPDEPLAEVTRRAAPVYTLHELEQYRECPRQYKYARVYKLLDPAESAVYRFHRFIRRGLRDLRDGPESAGWEEAEARLRDGWHEVGPAGHPYETYYWQHAREILSDEWRRLVAGSASAAPARLAVDLIVRLRSGYGVKVVADRVFPANDDTPEVLVRLHTGRPRDDDLKDLALPLYWLAYQQRQPTQPVRIAIAYVGRALADALPAGERSAQDGEPPPEHVVDATGDARDTAEEYLRPGRQRRNRLDKLDEAAAGISAGRFDPRPNQERCAACAFAAICPADPAADVTVRLSAPALSRASRAR
jgi:ATP-dependent DNA helicase UvrD/PcrA